MRKQNQRKEGKPAKLGENKETKVTELWIMVCAPKKVDSNTERRAEMIVISRKRELVHVSTSGKGFKGSNDPLWSTLCRV